jgi:hypothetical protein
LADSAVWFGESHRAGRVNLHGHCVRGRKHAGHRLQSGRERLRPPPRPHGTQ